MKRDSRTRLALSRNDFAEIWKKAKQDQVLSQATALAYTTILSLVPMLAVAFFLFNAFGGFETLQEKLRPLIEENLAPSFSGQISQYLENFVNNSHAGTVGVIGVIGFMFTSISTLATVEKAFNNIWGSGKQRRIAKRITTYWSLLTFGPLLIAISVGLSSRGLMWLRSENTAISHSLIAIFEVVPYFASGLLFTSLYSFMPNTYVDKRDALKAGFITGVAFEIAKLVYALYAARTITHSAVYGSLAVVPVFLLWLYVVWLVVLFGAELCCFYQYRRLGIPFKFGVEDRLNPFVVVDIIEALGDEQAKPKGGLTLAKLLETLKLPLRQLVRHIDFLETEGWVVMSEGRFRSGNKYYLTVAEEKIDITLIFKQLEGRRYVPRSERGQDVHAKFLELWANWYSLGKRVPKEKKDPR